MERLLVSVGEASADEHAARVVSHLLRTTPSLEVRGMGGSALRAAGMQTDLDSEKSASVMGFLDVLLSARKVLASFAKMKKLIDEWRPQALLILDYPDFNLRLAKYAHRRGVKTFYYITPQIWAWRTGRIHLIRRIIDHAAVIFPFEKDFFERHEYSRATYVGHPFNELLTRFDDSEAEESYRNVFLIGENLSPQKPVLAVFPGSRRGELEKHLPDLVAAISTLKSRRPEVQVVVAVAPAVKEFMLSSLKDCSSMHCIVGKSLDILRCADAALLKSGTSNLQAAFYGTPFSMFYQTARLSEFIVRHFVRLKEFSIVNILRQGTVREILQDQVTPASLSEEMEKLLFDKDYRLSIKNGLREVREMLRDYDRLPLFQGATSQPERVARLILHSAGSF